MMKELVYSVFDTKIGAYGTLIVLPSRGAAIRAFTDSVAGDKQLSSHPEDYVLFELGDWDRQSGKLLPYKAPESVIGAWQVLPAGHAAASDLSVKEVLSRKTG